MPIFALNLLDSGVPLSMVCAVIGLVFAFLLIAIVIFAARRHNAPFTPADRDAAHAMAAWHPPTDFLLRMPSTGVSR